MECDKEIPSVLIVSCAEKQPSEIAKLIIGLNNVPNCVAIENGVDAFPWHISTKYYEADVNLCAMVNKGLVSQKLASTIQAVIIYFDSNKADGLKYVDSWLPFLKEYGAEISILLCNKCEENPTTGVSKLKAQEWCIKEGFEFVEIEPEVEDEWESEQDFFETTGIERVVQALHAHIWPNLEMKDTTEPSVLGNLHNGGGINRGMADLRLESLPDMSVDRFEELLSGDFQDGDFSNFISQLQTLKERVSTLPNGERKACAEQVVMAFWKSIGGEDEEVDLSGDDVS